MCFASWPIELATSAQAMRAKRTASGSAWPAQKTDASIENATAAAGAMCVTDWKSTCGRPIEPSRRWSYCLAGADCASICRLLSTPNSVWAAIVARIDGAVKSAAFSARGLTKQYGSVRALAGVDVEVGEGELVGLLGPNGAGKSTLVKIGCGLVRASGGSAEVCGAKAGSREARAAMGYLAELFRFPGWCSANELLALHQRLAGSTGGGPERAELLELVGLTDARDRHVEDMSKGMQQRLGIAQALVGTPRMLFLDEPTSALDPAGRRTVRGLLEELRRRGVAVLLNSHLLPEVELVCDRVAIIA